jgi:hypothetical protein
MKFCPECGNPVEGYKKLLKIQEVKKNTTTSVQSERS